jgi:hypothetical protein
MVPTDLLTRRSDSASKIRNGMPKQLFRLSALGLEPRASVMNLTDAMLRSAEAENVQASVNPVRAAAETLPGT